MRIQPNRERMNNIGRLLKNRILSLREAKRRGNLIEIRNMDGKQNKKRLGTSCKWVSNIINKINFGLQRSDFSEFIKGVPLITHYERKIKQKIKKTKKKKIFFSRLTTEGRKSRREAYRETGRDLYLLFNYDIHIVEMCHGTSPFCNNDA